MRAKTVLVVAIIITSVMSLYACGQLSGNSSNDWNIETTSPQGTYCVIVEGKTDPPHGKFYSEKVSLKVLKGQELFFSDENTFQEGMADPHFRALYPVLQWVSESTLRMGVEPSSQPFSDEITVSNETKEKLSVVEIGYGRSERFLVFDLEPGKTIKLSAAPQFAKYLPAASAVAYKAYNLDKKLIAMEIVDGPERHNASEGPLYLQVEITRLANVK